MEKSFTKEEIEADPYKCLAGILPLLDCTGEESPLRVHIVPFTEEIYIKAFRFHSLGYR